MLSPLGARPQIPQAVDIPIADLIHAMDSKTTAKMLDRVDFGRFQPDETFSAVNAGVLTALAMGSYSTPEDQREHILKQPAVKGFQTLSSANNDDLGIPVPDKGANVTVVQTQDALIVAARGTSPPWLANSGSEAEWSWKDLGADLNTVPVDNYAKNAKVHQGFKDQADSIWPQLKPILQQAIATHKAIHMTGHSLGGAVALNLADRMNVELGVLPESVLRLGAPDIGWKDEKKHLDESGLSDVTVNVVNSGDPINYVLPGGKAAGRQLYYDRNGHADIGGGGHKWDWAVGKATDIVTGHFLIPLYRHFPQFYVMGALDPANAAVLGQLGKELSH